MTNLQILDANIHRMCPARSVIPTVAEGEHLWAGRSSAPDERPERGENSQQGRGHPWLSLTYIVETLNAFTAEHVFGKDR